MRNRITVALPLCLVLALIAACGDGGSTATPAPVAEIVPQPTATPTRVPDIEPEPTAAPTQKPPEAPPTSVKPDTPATSKVTGTITYRERIALSPDAVVEVKLSDVSLMDVAAVTIEEQVIRNPGQVPIEFEIEYDPDEIDERFTYAIQVRITEDGNLLFINDTAYDVITRNNPDHVDMVLVRVGGGRTDLKPAQPEMAETPAPIESVEVLVSESDPPEYSLRIVSGLPSGCVEFKGYDVSLDGNLFTVDVVNLEPTGPVVCTAIYETHEGEVALSGILTPGETYTVIVNGEVTNSFLVRTDRTGEPEMAETPAPIESVEVVVSESDPLEYSLRIVSGLPSGCVKFKGYDVSLDGTVFTVDVINLEPTGPVVCTAIYEMHEGEVVLDGSLTPDETYIVIVNGEVTNSFLARNDRTREWVIELSPIENVEVVVSESDPSMYSLNVISALPQGSTCSVFNGYDILRRSGVTIEVEVTHLRIPPGQIVPCTADYPTVSTEIPLGADFVLGQQYSVIVNGQVETFTARDN